MKTTIFLILDHPIGLVGSEDLQNRGEFMAVHMLSKVIYISLLRSIFFWKKNFMCTCPNAKSVHEIPYICVPSLSWFVVHSPSLLTLLFSSSLWFMALIWCWAFSLSCGRPTCSVIKTPIWEASHNSQPGRWRHGGKLSLDVLSLQDEIHMKSALADSSVALKSSSHILWIIHVVLHFVCILY